MHGEEALRRLAALPGTIGVYCENLCTGETFEAGADSEVIAASVIKIPVMITVFGKIGSGELSAEERYVLKEEDRLPSCGTLKAMHTGIEMTLMDLVRLMIIVSDNTATNILIRRVGMEAINGRMRELGLTRSTIRRLLFDSEASAAGIENTITAREMGMLFKGLHKGEILSPEMSRQMLDILLDQRLNGKIPFFLHAHGIRTAHKTGEDTGITHDVGIIYADEPMIACFVSEHADVAKTERAMQDAAAQMCGLN